ncbi:hypothetical protein RvY_15541 [Ramazzottius varieornatus]|uniref:Uncharacterized protein n=1 Tax=Ramazzottius varieornatus TaxID=947166 RepID=A0A1D1VVA8_RAMVA|nr:hypothetical protein RvY_15541 [Ramazzottius varieornatus]
MIDTMDRIPSSMLREVGQNDIEITHPSSSAIIPPMLAWYGGQPRSSTTNPGSCEL